MLTPDIPAGGDVYRILKCPAGVDFEALLNGALIVLADKRRWDEFGSMSIDDTAETFLRVYLSFREVNLNIVGSVIETVVEPNPEFYIPMRGQTLFQADWPELMPVIPAAWKSGANFTLPDARHVFRIGAGTVGAETIDPGQTGGEKTHTLTAAEMPTHSHLIGGSSTGLAVAPGELPVMTPLALPTSTGDAGLGQPHNNIPPYLAFIISIVGKLP